MIDKSIGTRIDETLAVLTALDECLASFRAYGDADYGKAANAAAIKQLEDMHTQVCGNLQDLYAEAEDTYLRRVAI